MSSSKLEHYKSIKPVEAKKLQLQLQKQITLDPLTEFPDLVGGADISFNRGSNLMHAAIIVLRLPDLKLIACSLVKDETPFPYIPGLLAFREMPGLLKAWQQLNVKPGVLILDGHGIAHPRRMGIATHFGIEVDHPAMGCAKNVLTGSYGELGEKKGATADLMDEGERVGMALRSRSRVNPVFISPGHRISFEDTYEVAMQCLDRYKLPETTRAAHQWANRLRRGEADPGYFEY